MRTTLAAFVGAIAAAGTWGGGPTGARAAAPPAPAVAWKHHTMQSAASGKVERFWIGHAADLKPEGPWPVVYFLPGLLDNETHWKNALDAHLGKHEVIAVCPSVGGATWFMNSPAQPWMRWGDFLTQELRAFVEANYPASRRKGQRGITGISSGAHGALYQALETDLYGSVSLLSGALELRGYAGQFGLEHWVGPRSPEAAPLYEARSCLALVAKREAPLPFDLSLDTGDKDGAVPQMEALKRILDSKNVPCKWFVGQGGHNWAYWASRAGEHLAWHAEQFARNRREDRFAVEAAAPAEAGLTPAQSPDIAPSEAAVPRLRAPWKEDGRAISLKGLPRDGAPLAKDDPGRQEVKLSADLPVTGHGPALGLFDWELVLSTPLRRAGTLTLTIRLSNGRGTRIASASVPLALTAGESNRRVPARVRLVVELKEPDPLRGGILLALQPFDADGRPSGEPVLGKARPGTIALEYWPLGPRAQVECTVGPAGAKDLPLAAVYAARLSAAAP